MENKDIDKLFEGQLSSAEMETDLADLWARVEPPKKRKHRFFLWLLPLMGMTTLGAWWYFSNTEYSVIDTVEQPVELLKTEVQDHDDNYPIGSESNPQDIFKDSPGIIPSTAQDFIVSIEKIKTDLQIGSSYNGKEENASSMNTAIEIEKRERASVIKESRNMELNAFNRETQSVDIIKKKGRAIVIDAKEEQLNSLDPVNSKILMINDELVDSNDEGTNFLNFQLDDLDHNLISTNWSMPIYGDIDTSYFKSSSSMDLSAKQYRFTIGLYSGLGYFDTNLSVTTDSGIALVEERRRTETDRFSFMLGVDMDYWINKKIGATIDFNYQRHFSYFEEVIDFNDYTQIDYRTTYSSNNRTIKSNVILNQLHTSILINYRLNFEKIKLIFSAGPSYNVYNKGEGKFYAEKDLVVDLKKERSLLQSTQLGLLAKCRIQYPLSKRMIISTGIISHFQSRSILSNIPLEQKLKASYLSLGINYAL